MKITGNGNQTLKVFPGTLYTVAVTGFDVATSGAQTIMQSMDGTEAIPENTFTSNDSYEFRACSTSVRFVTTGLGSGEFLNVRMFRANG